MHINAGSITLHEALHDGLDVGLQANIHVYMAKPWNHQYNR